MVGVGRLVLAEPVVQGTATLSSSTRPSAAARMPMLGSALTVSPSDADSTMNSAGLPFSWAAMMNSSASAAAGTSDLTPGEPVAAGSAHRGGLQCGRIEQRVRLGDRHARLRDVLAGELAEVGGLLVGAAPVRQRRRDAAGRQDRQGQAHVAVGQGLGDECVGDRAAVRGDAVEVLGDVDRRDAELGGLGDQVGRVGRGLVGVVCGGTQDLLGELVDRLDDHLLFVVGRQVEVVRPARLQPGGGLADALDPLELAGGCAQCRERRLDPVAQTAVERIAQPVLVQEFLARAAV